MLEQPRGYSFPLASLGPRLFLAENVAAVIEVKSNLRDQWNEVTATAVKLAQVRPVFASQSFADILDRFDNGEVEMDPSVTEENIPKARQLLVDQTEHPSNVGKKRIPLIVVGFEGWAKDSTIVEKLIPDRIDAILIISRKVYVDINRSEGNKAVSGPATLLAILHRFSIDGKSFCSLHAVLEGVRFVFAQSNINEFVGHAEVVSEGSAFFAKSGY
ncbi:MAG: hypothetical protein ABL921_21550, partial [Pirellula sp.]